MENQSDYGRFVLNAFKDKETKDSIRQEYLQDLHTILLQNKDFQDVEEVAYNKQNNQFLIKRNGEYQALETGFVDSILHAIHDTFNEISFSVAGAMYGGYKAVKLGKGLTKIPLGFGGAVIGGALGAGVGALIDEQINSWTTGYKNKDFGLKRASEAALLNIAGDFIIAGVAKSAKPLVSTIGKAAQATKDIVQEPLQKSKDMLRNANKFVSGNVNIVEDLLAKNAVSQSERDSLIKQAQDTYLHGQTLAEYKNDTNIPRSERLKNAFLYNRFINTESMRLGKEKVQDIAKQFDTFQTTSLDSNRPIMSVLQDVFENKATREEREKILRFVSQNETLKNAITSLLAKNPTLATNFGNFINKRTNAILESLQSEAITHRMFKDLDSAYGKELKHRYGKVEYDIKRALEGVNFKDTGLKIHAILDDLSAQIPHVTNSHQTITAMQEKLDMRGGNLTISDILDIRKYYNDILRSREWKNASYKHVQAINANIDSSVQESLESVSNLSGINTKKLWDNYADINKEYADYAKFKDSSFYKQSIKSQRKEKEPTNEEFTKAILKQAQRSEGFNNKVFERIAKNTSPTLQAQAIRELITKNLANPNGEYKAIKWQQLIEDLEKIEHSISDTRLQDFIGNLRLAKKLYAHDKEFLDSITHALGSKPASVLISAANGLFGRTLLLFYNFAHKVLSRYMGIISEKMLHENLEYQLSQALRYARDTKDFIHVSIESIQRNLPKEDKEAQRILQEFEYWKERLNTPSANAFYTMKEAKEIQDSLQKNEAITQEYHTALESYMPHIQSLQEKLNTIQNHICKKNTHKLCKKARH